MPTAPLTAEVRPAHSILTERQVRAIFELKYTHGGASVHAASCDVGKIYGVASKTIRDIWCGRCWLKSTAKLWREDDNDLLYMDETKRRRLLGSRMKQWLHSRTSKTSEDWSRQTNVSDAPNQEVSTVSFDATLASTDVDASTTKLPSLGFVLMSLGFTVPPFRY